mmetsp:Transcript_50069/g.150689  ORF Transcript_50069/g.150689 Transcript_50069/m.150689 type:complete len:245 (+) Transcript_50069:114-848(+)
MTRRGGGGRRRAAATTVTTESARRTTGEGTAWRWSSARGPPAQIAATTTTPSCPPGGRYGSPTVPCPMTTTPTPTARTPISPIIRTPTARRRFSPRRAAPPRPPPDRADRGSTTLRRPPVPRLAIGGDCAGGAPAIAPKGREGAMPITVPAGAAIAVSAIGTNAGIPAASPTASPISSPRRRWTDTGDIGGIRRRGGYCSRGSTRRTFHPTASRTRGGTAFIPAVTNRPTRIIGIPLRERGIRR